MTRTQIRLPDEVHARARLLCEKKEISMAELARRGIEYMLSAYSHETREWALPEPRSLGWKGLDESELKEAAQANWVESDYLWPLPSNSPKLCPCNPDDPS